MKGKTAYVLGLGGVLAALPLLTWVLILGGLMSGAEAPPAFLPRGPGALLIFWFAVMPAAALVLGIAARRRERAGRWSAIVIGASCLSLLLMLAAAFLRSG